MTKSNLAMAGIQYDGRLRIFHTTHTEIHMAVSFSADGKVMLMEAEFPVLPSK